MDLVCVRHGRTAWNAGRRFQGQTDIPLDDEGRAQALALGVHLLDEPFDAAIASDLQRARATAEAICAGRPIALRFDRRLREMHFGAWEGLTWTQIAEQWPASAERYEYSPRTYVPEGGESWAALCARVEAALRDFSATLPPDGRGLVVSHAGVMHATLAIVNALAGNDEGSEQRVRLAPASIVRLHGSFEGGWRIDAINETAPAVEPT